MAFAVSEHNRKQRRRRLTIAALVLLLLGGGLWRSTRPRIDPRLVGTWTVDDAPGTLIIRPDGLMTSLFGSVRSATGEPGFYLRFRMRGQNFEVVEVDPSASAWDFLKQTLERVIWKTPEPIPHRGTIVDITGDSFTLSVEGSGGKSTYRRVDRKETR
jgi:hypothetical protein